MDYTNDQYNLMGRLRHGVSWHRISQEDRWILEYFLEEKIARPRPDIQQDRYDLTEYGKRILTTYLNQQRSKYEKTNAERLVHEENVRREEEREQKQLDQIAADKAERKAEQRTDRVFQIMLTLLSSLLSFILGLAVEHYAGILEWFNFH